MFPEGGLSLTGALMRPKLGLLKYITDGFDPDGRDVVFIPVALNYDRVLEDTVLIAAANDPARRFHARIGVVAASALRQVWLRLTGRYHRFGNAAVSFGTPVSLKAFVSNRSGEIAAPLARCLMRHIGDIVPILPVPAVAWMLRANGPMSREALEIGLSQLIEALPEAQIYLPRDNRDYAIEVGLRNLVERGIIETRDGLFVPAAGQLGLLDFYANSIAHLVDGHIPSDSAGAKQVSATAGS
jgi:glycerol-3-phosphate O-acyltransferase